MKASLETVFVSKILIQDYQRGRGHPCSNDVRDSDSQVKQSRVAEIDI